MKWVPAVLELFLLIAPFSVSALRPLDQVKTPGALAVRCGPRQHIADVTDKDKGNGPQENEFGLTEMLPVSEREMLRITKATQHFLSKHRAAASQSKREATSDQGNASSYMTSASTTPFCAKRAYKAVPELSVTLGVKGDRNVASRCVKSKKDYASNAALPIDVELKDTILSPTHSWCVELRGGYDAENAIDYTCKSMSGWYAWIVRLLRRQRSASERLTQPAAAPDQAAEATGDNEAGRAERHNPDDSDDVAGGDESLRTSSLFRTIRSKCPTCEEFERDEIYPADQKLYMHMEDGTAHRQEQRKMQWDTSEWGNCAQCPICWKEFATGGIHPADQKLYLHMKHGKAHRREQREMQWDTSKRKPIWDNRRKKLISLKGKYFVPY